MWYVCALLYVRRHRAARTTSDDATFGSRRGCCKLLCSSRVTLALPRSGLPLADAAGDAAVLLHLQVSTQQVTCEA